MTREQIIEIYQSGVAEAHVGLLKELLGQNVDSPSKPVRTFCEGQLGLALHVRVSRGRRAHEQPG